MPHQVTSLEICADGMERLRNQSEWILLAYASGPADVESVLSEWRADFMNAPESWGETAALAALDIWADNGGRDLIARELESVRWGEWEGESIPCRLYIEHAPESYGPPDQFDSTIREIL